MAVHSAVALLMKGANIIMKANLRPVFLFVVCLLVGAAALLAMASPSRSLAAGKDPVPSIPLPHWGTDVHVDTVTADNHEAFSLAVNPTDPNKVLASFKYEGPQDPGSAYSLSTDAGRSWAGSVFTGPWGTDVMTPAGNTSVAFNAAGVAFLASRAESVSDLGYFVLTSTDGLTWGDPSPVFTTTNAEVRDQARLAVDQRASGKNAGSAYLVWHYSPGNDLGIFISYSRDGGATWSSPVQVSDPANNYSSHPVVQVASDGSVYVTFMQLDNGCYCNPPRQFVDRSTDGGVTWGPDQLVTGAQTTPVGALDVEGHDLVLHGGTDPEAGVEVNNFPVMAVAPNHPDTVYIVWNDGRWDTGFEIYQHPGKHGDIAFTRSTDGGATWSAPTRVNDDQLANGVDQFMPAIAIAPDGTIGVSWYDRRVNTAAYLYDVFYSQSTDGGTTWSRNERVSDASSDPMVGPNAEGVGDLGEYRSMVLGPDYALPSWLDSSNGATQEFYVDRGVAAACNMNFSDVSPSDYFYPAVEYLYCGGAISGYLDGTFKPYRNTIRGQLSKFVVLAEGWAIDTTGGPHFTDVPTTYAFYPYIETAYNRHILSGYADNTFRPGADVTRAQLSKIIVNAQGWAIGTTGAPHFTDVLPTDPFYGFIETIYNHGVISGYADHTFRPGNSATRGQISKIVYLAVTQP